MGAPQRPSATGLVRAAPADLALRSGRIRTEGIVTTRFSLPHFADALEAMRSDPTCLKAAIVSL